MIIGDFFFYILYQPLLNLLITFYHLLGDNLGLSIIAITILIKVVTYPLTKPSLEIARKQKELAPELSKLKEKYKDRQTLAQKQMELYKKHGINPAAGCLPQIIQVIVLIVLYRVFTDLLKANGIIPENVVSALYNFDFIKFADGESLKTTFLFYNLAAVDKTYSLPLIAAISQFFLSRQMQKGSKVNKAAAKSTPSTADDVMYNMQESMMYTFPIMTFVIGLTLPAGLSLYWVTQTFISIVQYLFLNRNSVKTTTPNN